MGLRVAVVGATGGVEEDAPLFFGPDPMQLSTEPGDVEAMGVPASPGPLVDVLLRDLLEKVHTA